MKCPRCQDDNPSRAKFCLGCGTPVNGSLVIGAQTPSYGDLERALADAVEQQSATSEILRGITSSPTDHQPVFDTIAERAMRLCDAAVGGVFTFDGELIHMAALANVTPDAADVLRQVWPMAASDNSASGRAILTGTVAHIPDVAADPRYGHAWTASVSHFRSIVAVPMIRDGRAIGVVTVGRPQPGRFSERQIDLLKTFADQAVIAIEDVRLFTELEARNRELTDALARQTATADILRAISQAQADVQPVFEAIADSAMRLFGAWSASVFRYEAGHIRLAAARGGLPKSGETWVERLQAPRLPAEDRPEGRAVLTRVVQHIVDGDSDVSWGPSFAEDIRLRGFRSLVAVPMLRGGDVVGVVGVARTEAGGFAPVEIALLQTFADQAVIAIENARLLGELQARTTALTRSVSELTALAEVSRALGSTLDLETVLQTIVSRAVQLSAGDSGTILEYDQPAEVFHPRVSTEDQEVVAALRAAGLRKGEGAVGRMAVTREPVQIPDIRVEGAYESRVRDALLGSGRRAVLALPLLREERVIGGLVISRNVAGEFPAKVIELLTTFATQSALAIQNARLFREIADKSRQLEVASQHKSEFLASMSHELRTPLNAIIGFSDVLLERMFGELNEKQMEYLQDILTSGQHLLSLINDILDLSKIEAGRMELELTSFDLPQAIDNALTLVRERAGRRGIQLHQAVDQRLGEIRADERKVKQVLLNLLSNALKFTPEGGRIDVLASSIEDAAEVSVKDTGVGIAPEDQEAVFEEFRQVGTASKNIEGTGLGLALCRRFVELHGGRISVKSDVGQGATFTFTIPVRSGA